MSTLDLAVPGLSFLLVLTRVMMEPNVNVTDLLSVSQSFLTHLINMLLSVPIVVLSTLGVLAFLGTNLLLSSMMSSLSASLSGKHCVRR